MSDNSLNPAYKWLGMISPEEARAAGEAAQRALAAAEAERTYLQTIESVRRLSEGATLLLRPKF